MRKQPKIKFNLIFEGQEVIVKYNPDYFTGFDHFEFISPYNPKRHIPLSKSGYCSHFAPRWEVESAPCIEAYVYELMTLLVDDESISRRPDTDQIKLFKERL